MRILFIDDDYLEVELLERCIKMNVEWIPVSWPLSSISPHFLMRWDLLIFDFRGTSHFSLKDLFMSLKHPNKILCSSVRPIEVESDQELLRHFVSKDDLCKKVKEIISERR
jgi:hypothetical protein